MTRVFKSGVSLQQSRDVNFPSKVTPIDRGRRKKARMNVIPVFPPSQVRPIWHESLVNLQSFSNVITVVLLTVVLGVYGQTIYIQKRWSDQYQSLEKLRRTEQQLNATNEVLKHEIATTGADPAAGLTPQNPQDMIFLESSSTGGERLVKKTPEKASIPLVPNSHPVPLGY